MSKILVTGSSNGLGLALVKALRAEGHEVIEYDINRGLDVLDPHIEGIHELDVLINNAGVNLIDWIEDITDETWDSVLGVNAKGIMKMTQACLPLLKASGGTVLNIVSNAAHVPMNSSLAYNASKGAAHIMTRQLARELFPRHGIHVLGIAPNKLAGTKMSDSIDDQVVRTRGWTKDYAHEYQLKAMPIGEETPVALVAEFVSFLLQDKEHHKFLHGCIIPYGA
jgi:3-hydroxybutyrate dehydrogenase